MLDRPDRETFLADALKALGSNDWRARRFTIAIAARYRKRTDPKHLWSQDRAARFKDIHHAVKREKALAEVLAFRLDTVSRRLHYALPAMGVRDRETYRIIEARADVARRLRALAAVIAARESKWPRGGNINLTKAAFGNPIRRLADESLKAFFHFGDMAGVRGGESPFLDYGIAVYGLATGRDTEGCGLEKAFNELARAYRRAGQGDRDRAHADLEVTNTLFPTELEMALDQFEVPLLTQEEVLKADWKDRKRRPIKVRNS